MRFRIGINLGDVMVDGSDIYGDGVNIAARLQELAEPGGVVVSGSVYDQVHNKLSLGFDCLGQQQMKNLAAPVMSYRVTMSDRAGGRRSSPAGEASTPQADGVAAAEADASSMPDGHGLSGWMRPVSDWFANLPRPIAAILVSRGLSCSDQCFHRPTQNLVPLASRIIAVDRYPVGSAPTQACVAQNGRASKGS